MPAAKLSLIVSTYENPAALARVLEGIASQSRRPDEILIADDGSGPATRALLEQWRSRLAMRHLWQEHQGFRKTLILNQSIAAATGDYVVLLDGDCVPHRHFILDHAEQAEKNFWVQGRRCFVVEKFAAEFSINRTSVALWCLGGRITGLGKAFRLPLALARRNFGQRGIIGCNMGIWRDDLVAVNGFDEEYTGWGGEDSDLGTRLYHLGRARKFLYGRAITYHLNHPPQSKERLSAWQQRLAATIASGKISCERGLRQYL